MKRFIVTVHRSAGNAEVGEMWTETRSFPETATLAEVEAWTNERFAGYAQDHLGGNGQVVLTYDAATLKEEMPF